MVGASLREHKPLEAPSIMLGHLGGEVHFIYSWAKDKEFGSIPEMVSRHQKSAVICTSKKTCDLFVDELKKLKVSRGIPIRLWTL